MIGHFWALYTQDMAHRHVLIGYAFAWLIQLAYLALVLRSSRRKPEGSSPDNSTGLQ